MEVREDLGRRGGFGFEFWVKKEGGLLWLRAVRFRGMREGKVSFTNDYIERSGRCIKSRVDMNMNNSKTKKASTPQDKTR